jgi:hypothetical protein
MSRGSPRRMISGLIDNESVEVAAALTRRADLSSCRPEPSRRVLRRAQDAPRCRRAAPQAAVRTRPAGRQIGSPHVCAAATSTDRRTAFHNPDNHARHEWAVCGTARQPIRVRVAGGMLQREAVRRRRCPMPTRPRETPGGIERGHGPRARGPQRASQRGPARHSLGFAMQHAIAIQTRLFLSRARRTQRIDSRNVSL